jgi:hypothetical protein
MVTRPRTVNLLPPPETPAKMPPPKLLAVLPLRAESVTVRVPTAASL